MKDFRPSVALKKYYYVTLLVISLIIIWVPIFTLFVPVVFLFIGLPIIVIILFAFYWIPKYYETMIYNLTATELTWRRGVWFKNTGIVPYNRITNIDISQGPVSRAFGISSLKIQTAGYSAPNARSSEIKIDGVEKPEEMRQYILSYIKGKKPVAVETYDKDEKSDELRELIKIRKLLEKKK